jgi:hypothetical protein
MHVGMSVIFQNPGEKIPDSQVYKQDLALARLAEPLGYDSIWSVEHHFTDYTMCPDVFQFLSYMAGCTEHIQLGSMVCVLPWHDPIRVVEEIAMLDNLSDGRVIIGMGRGTGRVNASLRRPTCCSRVSSRAGSNMTVSSFANRARTFGPVPAKASVAGPMPPLSRASLPKLWPRWVLAS